MKLISPHVISRLGAFLLGLVIFPAWAQLQVTGTVKDTKNETLPSVSILEKGTRNGVLSTSAGKFSIKVGSQNQFWLSALSATKSRK